MQEQRVSTTISDLLTVLSFLFHVSILCIREGDDVEGREPLTGYTLMTVERKHAAGAGSREPAGSKKRRMANDHRPVCQHVLACGMISHRDTQAKGDNGLQATSHF